MKSREVRVVRVPRRRWRALAIAAAVLAGLVLVAGSFRYGLHRNGYVANQTAALTEQITLHEGEIERLNKALVDAQVAAQVDRATVEELRTTLEAMHDERAHLREEVTFYRSLMAPSSLERGLQISEFALLEGATRQQYRYELLLTQVEARRSVVQGAVTIDLVGEQEGGQVVLPLTEMEPQTDYPLKYRFRYFQDFSGTLALPEGFEPQRVVVTVTRQGSREANLQRTFDWDIEVADA